MASALPLAPGRHRPGRLLLRPRPAHDDAQGVGHDVERHRSLPQELAVCVGRKGPANGAHVDPFGTQGLHPPGAGEGAPAGDQHEVDQHMQGAQAVEEDDVQPAVVDHGLGGDGVGGAQEGAVGDGDHGGPYAARPAVDLQQQPGLAQPADEVPARAQHRQPGGPSFEAIEVAEEGRVQPHPGGLQEVGAAGAAAGPPQVHVQGLPLGDEGGGLPQVARDVQGAGHVHHAPQGHHPQGHV